MNMIVNCVCAERTEKVPMNSIKQVVSEAIDGHTEYHMMVSHAFQFSFLS